MFADRVAADVDAGRLRPGDRLPTQRRFARQHGIATSTAARVYDELIRRGLAVGEVGRGTFVRAAEPPPEPALAEPGATGVDLELNFPALPDQADLLSRSLARLGHPTALAAALRPVGAAGTPAARDAVTSLLARRGWTPSPQRILFAGNGRQAIAAAIAALVPPGERLGVEPLTYPVVKGIAARLGVTLVPLETDADGIVPDVVPRVRAVYLQPALHNPLGVTMPDRRRAEVADVLARHDIYAIEDGIYGFLRPDLSPLAAIAPERTVQIDSLSKRLAPGLTIGITHSPPALTDRLASALRTGTWTAARFSLAAATQWITDGTANVIEDGKRRDAAARQQLARERLAGFDVQADAAAYHCWWGLPELWRAETFVAAAARRGIAVTPAAAFTVGSGHAPSAVRLALASPSMDELATALDVLAGLARTSPEDVGVE